MHLKKVRIIPLNFMFIRLITILVSKNNFPLPVRDVVPISPVRYVVLSKMQKKTLL